MKVLGFVLALVMGSTMVSAQEIFRIEIGKEHGSSEAELQRRVFYLERAVWQLQQRVFSLEAKGGSATVDTWMCSIDAMGDHFTGTGGSKAVAIDRVTSACKSARGGDGFFCKDAKCTNQ